MCSEPLFAAVFLADSLALGHCLCSIHLCVTLIHTKPGITDGFVSDLEECVAEIMKDPKAKCGGQVSASCWLNQEWLVFTTEL